MFRVVVPTGRFSCFDNGSGDPLTRPASRDTLSPKGARAVVLISCFAGDAVHSPLCAGMRRLDNHGPALGGLRLGTRPLNQPRTPA
jgi:hypothetical protein